MAAPVAPVVAPAPPAAPAQAAPAQADRVVPILLVGGSVALLALVMLFVVLTIGVPLLLSNTAQPTGPVAKAGPIQVLAPALPVATPPVEPAPEGEPVETMEPVLAEPEPAHFEFETPAPKIKPRPVPRVVPRLAPRPRPTEPAPEFQSPTPIVRPPVAVAPEPELAAVSVKIYSRPPAASVVVDGTPTGVRTPNKLNLTPGRHRVDLRLRGYNDQGFDLLAGTGQPGRWCVDFLSGRTFQGACPR